MNESKDCGGAKQYCAFTSNETTQKCAVFHHKIDTLEDVMEKTTRALQNIEKEVALQKQSIDILNKTVDEARNDIKEIKSTVVNNAQEIKVNNTKVVMVASLTTIIAGGMLLGVFNFILSQGG